MEKALQLAVEREARRAGTSKVENKEQILELLNKSTNVMTSSTFAKDEVIEFTPEKASLLIGAIRGGSEQMRLMVSTNKGTKNLYLTTFHKSRVFVDESNPQNPVVTDVRKDNYNCPVAEFFETCPTQLIFAAAMCGCKVKCTKVDNFKAAGFDPNGGPNGTGGTDMDPKHATNATLCLFDFVGKKPEIKEEWLGEDGDEKAAEYLFNFYKAAA
jgi:hypothetical protein